MDAPAVPVSTFAAGRCIHLTGRRKVGEADSYLPMFFQTDQYAPGAGAADEVARAVDRIDNPLAAVARFAGGTLLAKQAIVGKRAQQLLHDEFFACPVGDRHRRFVRLDFDTNIALADL